MSTQLIHSMQRPQRTAVTEKRFRRFIQRLERLSGRTLQVRFHRNRWIYFYCRALNGTRHVRVHLHESFLEAPPNVVRAVTTLIRREDAEARRVIRSFIESQSSSRAKLAERRPRPLKINPRGKVYDLHALFGEINKRYFEGRCSARITWSNSTHLPRGRRQITFGTYDKTAGLIRIHPILDERRVPEYFVRYITFHEMLHATTPAPLSPSGRRLYHSRLFRQRERTFEEFERAQKWERYFVEEVI